MQELDFLFGEEDFENKMNNIVLPILRINLMEGEIKSFDGKNIHYYYLKNPNEKAAVVISHGFCEFNGKYHELMYYFYEMGYSVFMPEHRGHGYSYRECEDLCKVHIDDFDTYVEDFKQFINQVVAVKSDTKKYILFAHSMGGAVGALFLEKYPEVFKKAVLSSPMMQLRFGNYSMAVVKTMLTMAKLFRWKYKYAPGQHGFDNIDVFDTSSALSRPRYDYVFKLRQQDPMYCTYGSTYGWTMAAAKSASDIKKKAHTITTPILLCQAGLDSLVQPGPQKTFARTAKNVKLIKYNASKHEIFNATEDIRKDYYKEIFEFLK